MVIGLLLYRPSGKQANKIRWTVLGFAAFAAAGAAFWFVGLQIFWLDQICPYCLVAHVAGIILAAVYLASHPLPSRMVGSAGLAAAVSLAGLVSLQTFTKAPPTYEVIEYESATQQSSTPEQETLFEAPASSAVSVDSKTIMQERTLDIRPEDARSLLFALINPSTLFIAQVEA